MSEHEPVDLVVGADGAADDPGDEELDQPEPGSRLPWLVAAAVIATAVVAALAEQHAAHGTRPPAAEQSAVSVAPQPLVVSQTAQLELPEGNRRPRAPAGCPSGAECFTDTILPRATVTALQRDFPSAQLISGSSVLANRDGRFEPHLVTRLIHARAGSIDILVSVRKPQRGDRDVYRYRRDGQLLHSLDTHAGSAFTVTVDVVQLGPKHRPSRPALARIARDTRLVQPQ